MESMKPGWIYWYFLLITACLFGTTFQAGAETLNYKFLNRVTHRDAVQVGDVEGHMLNLTVREGVMIFENGEIAWSKAINSADVVKGGGTFDQYSI